MMAPKAPSFVYALGAYARISISLSVVSMCCSKSVNVCVIASGVAANKTISASVVVVSG